MTTTHKSLLRGVRRIVRWVLVIPVAYLISFCTFRDRRIALAFVLLALPWGLLLLALVVRRQRRWTAAAAVGGAGSVSSGSLWPKPTRPPVLSGAAAKSLPRPVGPIRSLRQP
jgi:hypothetical protein